MSGGAKVQESDCGLGKMRGFSHIHNTAAAIGTNAHHPSQTRLQIAKISNGKTVKRVQTLQGLA